METVSDILGMLTKYSISMEVHEATRIGFVVQQVKKDCTDQEISRRAKNLLATWKKIVKERPIGMSPTADKKTVGGSTDVTVSTAPAAAATATVSADGAKLERECSSDAYDSLHLKALPESRRKIYEKLKGVFVESDASLNENVAGALAISIENAINDVCPFVKDNKAYLLKCRDYSFNLKKNDKLREAVLCGQLQAKTLALMTSRDMATDEQKADRAIATKLDLDATSSSFIRDNIARIEKENGIDAVEGQYGACRKCGGTRTTHYLKQMRSSDEPMTVFINCLQCGTQWRKG